MAAVVVFGLIVAVMAFVWLPILGRVLAGLAVVWLILFVRDLRRQTKAARLAGILAMGYRAEMSPYEFEVLVAAVLADAGWQARVVGQSGDQGADVIADRGEQRLVVQCKKWISPVGNKAVQEAYAAKAFTHATHAAVVTNATFTPAAYSLSAKTGVLLLHYSTLRTINQIIPRPVDLSLDEDGCPAGRSAG